MKKKKAPKSAAILTVKDVDCMTKAGRAGIARWLHKEADDIIRYGHTYSKTVRMRFLYS